MALDPSKSGFRVEPNPQKLDLEARFSRAKATPTSHEQESVFETSREAVPTTQVYHPEKETMSKRTYGLAKPSVYEKIVRYAKANGTSYNEIVNSMLEEFIDRHNL